jgi:hypothetical protein
LTEGDRMSDSLDEERLAEELHSFDGLWKDGYSSGDPLDPLCTACSILGYVGLYHAVYLTCIKPHVNETTVALEIGPGRGSWTRILRQAAEVWCLDALSAEHNGFWDYVGRAPNINYFQVEDFTCSMLADDKFDYLFSYGALCHVSFDGITAYAKNLYPKLRKGAQCFFMVADYEKYNLFIDRVDDFGVLKALVPQRRFRFLRPLFLKTVKVVNRLFLKRKGLVKMDMNEDNEPRPGRWYHAGTERICRMLEEHGYRIVASDVGAHHRDPIIHFEK